MCSYDAFGQFSCHNIESFGSQPAYLGPRFSVQHNKPPFSSGNCDTKGMYNDHYGNRCYMSCSKMSDVGAYNYEDAPNRQCYSCPKNLGFTFSADKTKCLN